MQQLVLACKQYSKASQANAIETSFTLIQISFQPLLLQLVNGSFMYML